MRVSDTNSQQPTEEKLPMHAKHIRYQINDIVMQRNARREFPSSTSIYLVYKQSSQTPSMDYSTRKTQARNLLLCLICSGNTSLHHNKHVFYVKPLLAQFTMKSIQDNELLVILIHSQKVLSYTEALSKGIFFFC